MNVCINCTYFDDGFVGDNCIGDALCIRPVFSKVYGQTTRRTDPNTERSNTHTENCGELGQYYHPKTPTPAPRTLLTMIFS